MAGKSRERDKERERERHTHTHTERDIASRLEGTRGKGEVLGEG